MRIVRVAATGSVLLVATGCADGGTVLGPASPALASSPARQVEASGDFDAIVDFTTLTLTPRGRNCLLQVEGKLVFTGTIQGKGKGQTTALVFAPCSQVANTPPGTFRDVFKSELTFKGTIDGRPARASVLYMGGVEPGGHIDGRLIFSNGVAGKLDVAARVAVGGDYRGSLVVR